MPPVEGAPPPPAQSTGGGGFFQRKVFGVKTWQLMLVLTIAVLGWALYRQRQAASAATSTSLTGATTPSSGTNAQYTPPYVIQTDVNEAPVNVTDNTPVTVNNPAPRPRRPRRPAPPPPPGAPSPPPSAPPTTPAPVQTKPSAPGFRVYRVKPGDNLTTIARDEKVFQTSPNPGLALYNYQLTPGLRSAQDQATIKQRGPNLIFSNEEIYIPNS